MLFLPSRFFLVFRCFSGWQATESQDRSVVLRPDDTSIPHCMRAERGADRRRETAMFGFDTLSKKTVMPTAETAIPAGMRRWLCRNTISSMEEA